MKREITFIAISFLLLSYSGAAFSQSFTHPGVMNTKKDLDFVKNKVSSNAQPWKAAYDNLKNSKYTNLNYSYKTYDKVECGSYNKPNVGCDNMVEDGIAAYSMVLRWYIDGDKKYADQAIKIINDWSLKYRSNTESNSRLIVSWAAPWYVSAAEILRYTSGSGWATANTNNLNAMLNRFKEYVFWEGRPNNNWMMSSVEARLAIAVFQDDRAAFNDAVAKWKVRVPTYIYQKSDGNVPINSPGVTSGQTASIWKSSSNGTSYVDGHSMETCRDMNHMKLGLMSILNGAEIAWSQGVDLFSVEKERIKDCLELHGNWMLGATVPNSICGGDINFMGSREGAQAAFEIAYNHLSDRLKMNLPKTQQMITNKRPNGAGKWVNKWETLCYAERPFGTITPPTNNPPTGKFTAPTSNTLIEGYTALHIIVEASDPDNDEVTTMLNIDGKEIRAEGSAPYEWGHVSTTQDFTSETLNLGAGDHLLEVVITDAKGAKTTISKTITVLENKAPFNGTPIAIPGTLQVENYDKGGQGVSYSDVDAENKGSAYRTDGVDIAGDQTSGYMIGWTSDDEWLEYSVDVIAAGDYDLDFYTSSLNGGGLVSITLGGQSILSNVTVPKTGDWNKYEVFTEQVTLTKGKKLLRFNINNAGFNIDKIVFKPVTIASLSSSLENDLFVYPNPSENGMFKLSIETTWEVYTTQGLKVIEGNNKNVDLSTYAKGIYLLKTENAINKIIVK